MNTGIPSTNIPSTEASDLHKYWMSDQTSVCIIQLNIYNPQLNLFLNLLVIANNTPLNRVAVGYPVLRNFKTTVYGLEDNLGATVKVLDFYALIYCGLYICFMFVEVMYKEQNINTEYLKSGECLLNLFIIAAQLFCYYNARHISDTDTQINWLLDYTENKYLDYSAKVIQF